MEQRPIEEDAPVWRETPLDHWSTEIDPVLMSGDEWVDEADPGTVRMEQAFRQTLLGERFMHPVHDVTYGLDEDMYFFETE